MTTPPHKDPIRSLMFEQRGTLFAAVVLVSLAALLELVPNLIVYFAAVEVFEASPTSGRLMLFAAFAFGGVIIRFLMLGSGYILSHRAAFAMMRSLRMILTEKLARVPSSVLTEHSSGALKKTIVDDVASLEGVFAHNLPELASGVIVPVVAALVLASVDWRLALAALALLPVAFGVQAVVMSGFQETWAQWHAAEARANQGVLEFIRGIVVLKAFDRDASSLGQVREGVAGIRDLAVAMTRRSMAGYSLFFSLMSGNLLVVLPVGITLYLSDEISRNELVLFVALGAGMLMPLLKLLFLFGDAQKISAALVRIRALLDAPELEEPAVTAAVIMPPGVCFDAVTFRYPGREDDALSGVSFTLEPGTLTAVIGSSGAGKTTLAKLLVRAYDAQRGSIQVGGCDVRELSTQQRASLISHVSQQITLFDGSVRENLQLASSDATDDELIAAAKAARAHDFIMQLPDGYDTQLGDRGGRLSGGERQRIAIARAILKDAPIVVLDEITANVDAESERGIQDGVSALARDRTVLVIAHRLKTIAKADQIIVVEDGRVLDAGKHEELSRRCEMYASLWRDQDEAGRWMLVGGAA